MSIDLILILFVVGMIAGCVSSIAGGSGLITFPVLLSIGLPPTIANATNFVSVLMGNAAALPAYVRELGKYRGPALRMVCAGLAGGGIGSVMLLNSSDTLFLELVPWLISAATLLFALSGKIKVFVSTKKIGFATLNSPLGYVLVFIVSIYGGYFGAGLGVILLATLSIIGFTNFHEANALKNLTNTMIGLLGVIIYAFAGLISWPHALILMTGSAVGGYFGVRLARFVPQLWLSNCIVVLGVILSIYYFLN